MILFSLRLEEASTVGDTIPWLGCRGSELSITLCFLIVNSLVAVAFPSYHDGLYPCTVSQNKPFSFKPVVSECFITVRREDVRLGPGLRLSHESKLSIWKQRQTVGCVLYKFNSSPFLERIKSNHVFFAGDPPLMESEITTHGSPGCLLRSRKFWGEMKWVFKRLFTFL